MLAQKAVTKSNYFIRSDICSEIEARKLSKSAVIEINTAIFQKLAYHEIRPKVF
jgi:hypothetical protein